MMQQVTKLEYNTKAAVGAIKDFKNVLMQSYYKIREFKYAPEANNEIVKSELVVGIKILLNIVFITL